MNQIHQDFTVCGISVRTNNELETGPQGNIGKLWERFFNEGIIEKIPHKAGFEILAVYSNYESDYTGEYDYLIGIKVSQRTDTDVLRTVTIPSGNYLHLKSEKGPTYKVVPELWMKVWNMGEVERAYISDFEVYGSNAMDPNNAVVELFLGVK